MMYRYCDAFLSQNVSISMTKIDNQLLSSLCYYTCAAWAFAHKSDVCCVSLTKQTTTRSQDLPFRPKIRSLAARRAVWVEPIVFWQRLVDWAAANRCLLCGLLGSRCWFLQRGRTVRQQHETHFFFFFRGGGEIVSPPHTQTRTHTPGASRVSTEVCRRLWSCSPPHCLMGA